ncbi:MAG: helix-turn-helix domain-containing protein [Clostridium sp.]|nr:helix-turn-helix domain-containing protein [Clostridium sp.]
MTLGNRLYEMRKSKGLSQEKAAEILGVTRQTISKWETNQSTPDFDKILPLCDLYEISTDELVKGIKAEENPPKEYNNPYGNDYDSVHYDTSAVDSNDDSIEKSKRKSSLLIAIAIGLYIISVIPFFIFDNSKPMLCTFFLIVAAATVLVVFGAMSKTKQQINQLVTKEHRLYKQITTILSGITLILYMLISFLTKAWQITWLMWVIYGIVCEIIKLIFTLKGNEANDAEK